MNSFMQTLSEFAMGTSFWVYVYIFVGKLLEVSFGTLRIVLINRGMRTVGALIAIVEIMLWLIVASSVLVGFSSDFMKGIVYALAFAAGNYVGSWLDEILAFGLSAVQVVISDRHAAKRIEESLRAKGFGVTSMDVHGMDDDHYMLMMTMKRKRLSEVTAWLEKNCVDAVITVSDIKTQHGGYMKKGARVSSSLKIGKG